MLVVRFIHELLGRVQLSNAHLFGKSEFISKLEDHVLLLQPRDASKEEIAALCRFLMHKKVPA